MILVMYYQDFQYVSDSKELTSHLLIFYTILLKLFTFKALHFGCTLKTQQIKFSENNETLHL